jgi:hypothetical protein
MERNCDWPGCQHKLLYSGRGRPKKYCRDHASASKKALDKARPKGGHVRKDYPQCCVQAQLAGVKTYGYHGRYVKRAKVITCEQHREWVVFRRGAVREYWEAIRSLRDPRSTEFIPVEGSDDPEDDVPEAMKGYSLIERKSFNRPLEDPERQCISLPERKRRLPASWYGYDPRLERMTREFLASARNNTQLSGRGYDLAA